MILPLVIPAFVAGLLTFLAPCTFPLLPAYIALIGGSSVGETKKPSAALRKKIFVNGLIYILGFSAVFIIFGSIVGLGGLALLQYKALLSKIGGAVIIFFGLETMGLINLPFPNIQRQIPALRKINPGEPLGALLFGISFALGWTPCVGPILGAILTLAAASQTVWHGAFLLAVFSAGLAIPFLLLALFGGWILSRTKKFGRILVGISVIGGVLLILLGILLITGGFAGWISSTYGAFNIFHYNRLLKYF